MNRIYRNDISAELSKTHVSYDPVTGHFTHLGGRHAGTRAGSVNGAGYVVIYFRGHYYLGHRLAWLHHYGTWPINQIDHIDGDTTNNAISNLREATITQNQRNAARRGYHREGNKWVAKIKIGGKCIRLGSFDDERLAREARVAAEQKYFGSFGVTSSRGKVA